ncbi:DinB family protein [Balneola vulgaris]|uniref:DinB family protein n=1 Tax=Balneola vulgaris TaxID=287535 RepID=UPI0003A3215C|nr:DinB family protein [Balneola vulgaris]
MNPDTLCQLFARDFETLESEIMSYNNEHNLWIKESGINNSGGNLALHIAGNLSHFFGSVISKDGYERDRDFEFNGKTDRSELLMRIRAAKKSVCDTLDSMTDEELSKNYPIEPFGHEMTVEYFFMHLYAHMSYHLGQINYHRRLLDN